MNGQPILALPPPVPAAAGTLQPPVATSRYRPPPKLSIPVAGQGRQLIQRSFVINGIEVKGAKSAGLWPQRDLDTVKAVLRGWAPRGGISP
jgi:hypothetical protein